MLKNLFSSSLVVRVVVVVGVLGLVLSLLGEATPLGNYTSSSPRIWEQFDPRLVDEAPDLTVLTNKLHSLIESSQTSTSQEKMLLAYNLVISRFSHGDQAKYNIFSNWPLWGLGKVSSPFSYIRNPEILVEKGHSALCAEQAYLLQILAEGVGVRTRAVGLDGHVVMEVWYDDDWHLFDPDLEVVPLLENGRILSLDELAKSPESIRKYYMGRGTDEYLQSIVDIISSRENNSFSSYPRLALFEWKTNVLFHFEKIANVMKWLFPMILLLTGCGLYFRKIRKK